MYSNPEGGKTIRVADLYTHTHQTGPTGGAGSLVFSGSLKICINECLERYIYIPPLDVHMFRQYKGQSA